MGTMTTLYTFPFPSTAVFTPQLPLACQTVQSAFEWNSYDKWIRYREVWSMWRHEKFKVDTEGVNP
jgi:hypothetical protein